MIKRRLKRLCSRIDSLDFLRMARDLEEQLDVLLEDKALAGASTVADLVEVCCAAMSAQAAG